MTTKKIKAEEKQTGDYLDAIESARSKGDVQAIEEAIHANPDNDFMCGLQEAYDYMTEYQNIEKARETVRRIAGLPQQTELNIAYLTREWVLSTSGWWRLDQLYNFLGLKEYSEKQAVFAEVLRLKKKGVVAKHRTENGKYRLIDNRSDKLNIRIGKREGIEIYLPFGLHDMVKLFDGNIVLITGQKDSGKTAICIDPRLTVASPKNVI